MQVRAVDFIGIPVKDIPSSQAFYGETLGLTPSGSFGETWAEYDAGGTTLALIKVDAETIDAAHSGGPYGTTGVALAVPDVAAAVEELRGKGVPIAFETAEYPPCFMAVVQDPSGNWLFLHQRKDGTAG